MKMFAEHAAISALLVEDNADDAFLIGGHLKRNTPVTCELTQVSSLQEALSEVAQKFFDVILLDLTLPDSQGLQTVDQVVAAAPDLPIVILTGLEDEKTWKEALRQGAQDYVSKHQLDGALLYRSMRYAIERKRAARALQKSEEQLRQLLAQTPAVFYKLQINDQKITPVFVSGTIQRLLGFEVAESASYQWWMASLHPEDRDRVLEVVRQGFAGQGYSIEYRLRHKNGTYRWVQDDNRVIGATAGRGKEAVGVWTDITERKALEAALVSREQRLNAFFKGATAGLALFDMDLRYVQINDTLAEMNGVAAEDHLGRTIREVLPQLAPQAEPIFHQVLLTGKPVLNVEIAGRTHSHPEMQRHWVGSFFPIPGKDGTPDGAGAIVVEVTERKLAEKALRHSEERYRSLAESAEDAIFVVNRQFRLEYINQAGARRLGRSPTELIGMSIMDLFPAETAAQQIQHMETVFQSGLALTVEEKITFPQATLWFNTQFISLRSAGGELVRVLGIGRDISERKQAEEKLCESQAMLARAEQFSHIMVTLLGLDGRWLKVPPTLCSLLGYTESELLSRTLEDVTAPDDRERDWQQYQN